MQMIRVITRRDLVVALAAAGATIAVTAAAPQPAPAIQRSAAFDWASVTARSTEVGSVRQFLRAPTATLNELEIHVTTLKPGVASHAPHHHPNEELVIIQEGTVEALVKGEWKRVGPGSIIFNASNEEHALRNVGSGPTTYHVINWTSTTTPKAQPRP
jgi:XRE family transcriptional regulator, regulator of sulfur utilization